MSRDTWIKPIEIFPGRQLNLFISIAASKIFSSARFGILPARLLIHGLPTFTSSRQTYRQFIRPEYSRRGPIQVKLSAQ